MSKRVLGIILALCMIMAFMPLSASAATITVETEAELTQAITDSNSGDIIKLGADIDLTETVEIPEDKTVTIDLNGCVLNGGTITNFHSYRFEDTYEDGFTFYDCEETSCGSVITNFGALTLTDSDKTTKHYYKVNEINVWVLDNTATEGTAYESLNARPATDDVIEIKGGAITGGTGYVDKMISNTYDGEEQIDGRSVLNCYGGGIYSTGSLSVENATICGNTSFLEEVEDYDWYSFNGAGILSEIGSELNIKNSLICGNSSVAGCGVYCYSDELTIDSCNISFNTQSSDGSGGGIYFAGYDKALIKNTIVSFNIAKGGGGVYLGIGEGVIENSVIKNNGTKTNNEVLCYGGGIYNFLGELTVVQTSIIDNIANQAAGIFNNCMLTLEDTTITGNHATKTSGGVYSKKESVDIKTEVCGETIVAENYVETDEKKIESNLDMDKGCPIVVGSTKPLSGNANIGLTCTYTEEEEVINYVGPVTTPASDDYTKYFFSDNVNYKTIKGGEEGNLTVDLVPAHAFDTEEDVGGEVTTDLRNALKDEIVTLSAKVNDGYKLIGFTVKGAVSGKEIPVIEGKFVMPDENVIITPIFEKLPETNNKPVYNSDEWDFDSDSLGSCGFLADVLNAIKSFFSKLFNIVEL